MAGHILLEGGMEFGGMMSEPDRVAIKLAGGEDALISIIPTAAAPDKNDQNAGRNGVLWFRSLGARHVESLPIIDRQTANDPDIAAKLRQSNLIYLLGGFPGYLAETLKDTLCWQAALEAYEAGAVLGGSSAGAMVFCQYYYDPQQSLVAEGLNLLPNTCVLPHFNNFGKGWAKLLSTKLPTVVLVGIDEQTGMIDDAHGGSKVGWHVYGAGSVTLYHNGEPTEYRAGESFKDNFIMDV
ncbi:MAG TPA: cyanophycinase [Ktedonobacteraceae bacterium]|nr:cyanophycinase [Ktedonobacteraceae bacterium]